MVCKHCLVSGKVQGVFYRASTAERARALNITGYAKNLPDGCVEVLACGDEAKVRELIDWLWKGPPAAKVGGVAIEEAEVDPKPSKFETR